MPDDAPETPPVIHDAQITPAHVLDVLNQQIIPRLDRLENTVKESGLNGHTPYLKAFLEQYAGTYATRQAWITVRSDLKHRMSWLAPSKRWLAILFGSILGAIGWQLVSHLTGVQLPPI